MMIAKIMFTMRTYLITCIVMAVCVVLYCNSTMSWNTARYVDVNNTTQIHQDNVFDGHEHAHDANTDGSVRDSVSSNVSTDKHYINDTITLMPSVLKFIQVNASRHIGNGSKHRTSHRYTGYAYTNNHTNNMTDTISQVTATNTTFVTINGSNTSNLSLDNNTTNIKQPQNTTSHPPVEYFNDKIMTSTYELTPKVTCSRRHTFLIYVMSAMKDNANRMAIRNTWTDLDKIDRFPGHGFHVERMFVVGGLKYVDKDMAQQMRDEQAMFGDILTIDDLKDDYGNLTKKTIFTMFWINNTCNITNVDYLMKADDDILLNIYYILTQAWTDLHRGAALHFICFYMSPRAVLRTGKYAEPVWRYPETNYPGYCQGPAYTYHVRVLQMILQALPRVPILRSEDVMLTGVCLQNFPDINIHKFNRKRVIFDVSDIEYIQSKRFKFIRNFEEVIHAHQLPIKHWQETFFKMNNGRLMGDLQVKFTRVRRTQH